MESGRPMTTQLLDLAYPNGSRISTWRTVLLSLTFGCLSLAAYAQGEDTAISSEPATIVPAQRNPIAADPVGPMRVNSDPQTSQPPRDKTVHQMAPAEGVAIAREVSLDTSVVLGKIKQSAELFTGIMRDQLLELGVASNIIAAASKSYNPPREDEFSLSLNDDSKDLITKLRAAYPVDGALAFLAVSERGDYVVTAAYLLKGSEGRTDNLSRIFRAVTPSSETTVETVARNAECAALGIANTLNKLSAEEKIGWIACSKPISDSNKQISTRGMLDDIAETENHLMVLPPTTGDQSSKSNPAEPQTQVNKSPKAKITVRVLPPTKSVTSSRCLPDDQGCQSTLAIYPSGLGLQVFKSGLEWRPAGLKRSAIKTEFAQLLTEGKDAECLKRKVQELDRGKYKDITDVMVEAMSTPRMYYDLVRAEPYNGYSFLLVPESNDNGGGESNIYDPRRCFRGNVASDSLVITFPRVKLGETNRNDIIDVPIDERVAFLTSYINLSSQIASKIESANRKKGWRLPGNWEAVLLANALRYLQTNSGTIDFKFWANIGGGLRVFRVQGPPNIRVDYDDVASIPHADQSTAAVILIRNRVSVYPR